MLFRLALAALLVLAGFLGESRPGRKATTARPDWGGGRLSFPSRPAARMIDSAAAADPANTRSFAGAAGSVALRRNAGEDFAVALALPGLGLFELPSSASFRRQLLPGSSDASPPAPDIPLYPDSDCRTQVRHSADCFVGFYLTPDGIEAVRSFYVKALGRLGWRRVAGGGAVETFTKSGADRTLVVQLREQDSALTRIGLVAMAGMGR